MNLFELAGLVVTLAALFAFVNRRWIGLPDTIGVMVIALAVSLAIIAADALAYPRIAQWAERALEQVDFSDTVLHGMLSFLLFAGALFVDLDDLARRRYVIAALATVGVVISTFLVGTLAWWILGALGLPLPWVYCLLFGALISPTDPIAVLGILKAAGVPRSLEVKITGESLFNDGVAVVVFLVLLEVAAETSGIEPAHIARLFGLEVGGGLVFGLLIGAAANWMLLRVDDYTVEVLITLAVVMGGYALAVALHLSGPLAMVVAGLLLGSRAREHAMSARTREHLDTFWELIDEILNAVLFVLLGLEVLLVSFGWLEITAGLAMIPVVLLARFVAVGVPVTLLRPVREFSHGVVKILTWGGLRGGISVALALSLPAGEARDLLLPMTYVVVLFSLLVQGLSVGRVARRLSGGRPASPEAVM